MRKVVFPVANSVDNFIATKDGGVDWLLFSEEIEAILATMWENVGAVVMGRNTYEFMLANGMDSYENVENYIFSSTLDPAKYPKVTIVSDDAAEFISALKQKDGGEIWMMGGASLARDCFRAGLIDELHLNFHPIVLGAGAPLFLEMDQPIDLELIECRELPKGCVALTYRVKHE